MDAPNINNTSHKIIPPIQRFSKQLTILKSLVQTCSHAHVFGALSFGNKHYRIELYVYVHWGKLNHTEESAWKFSWHFCRNWGAIHNILPAIQSDLLVTEWMKMTDYSEVTLECEDSVYIIKSLSKWTGVGINLVGRPLDYLCIWFLCWSSVSQHPKTVLESTASWSYWC